MSLVLDPRHKLEYFKTAGWDREWIDTARELVRNQYNSRYVSRDVTDGEDAIKVAAEAPKETRKVSSIF